MPRQASKTKRGPKPETVKIEGDWKGAMGKALKKAAPAAGWPTPQKPRVKK